VPLIIMDAIFMLSVCCYFITLVYRIRD